MRISLLPRLLPHHIAQCSSNAAHSTRSPSHVVCAHVAASLAVLLAGQANTGRYIDGRSTQACRETHGRCETDSRETHETHGHETHGRETHGRERPTAARDSRQREIHGSERPTATRDPRPQRAGTPAMPLCSWWGRSLVATLARCPYRTRIRRPIRLTVGLRRLFMRMFSFLRFTAFSLLI